MKKLVSTWILFSSVLALVLSVAAFAQTADKSSAENKSRPALRGTRALGPFTLFDANHDGVLSTDEIRNASDALWRLDKNGDGRLTPAELRPEGAPPPPREDRPPPEREDDI